MNFNSVHAVDPCHSSPIVITWVKTFSTQPESMNNFLNSTPKSPNINSTLLKVTIKMEILNRHSKSHLQFKILNIHKKSFSFNPSSATSKIKFNILNLYWDKQTNKTLILWLIRHVFCTNKENLKKQELNSNKQWML